MADHLTTYTKILRKRVQIKPLLGARSKLHWLGPCGTSSPYLEPGVTRPCIVTLGPLCSWSPPIIWKCTLSLPWNWSSYEIFQVGRNTHFITMQATVSTHATWKVVCTLWTLFSPFPWLFLIPQCKPTNQSPFPPRLALAPGAHWICARVPFNGRRAGYRCWPF